MQHIGTRTIETKRMVLRRFHTMDAEDMLRNYCTDTEVTKFLTWNPHKDIDETKELLITWTADYSADSVYNWAIEFNGEVVGGIAAVDVDDANRCCEVGYCLSRQLWGQGLVTEALIAVLDFLINEVGFNRVMTKHDALNPASGMVMRKAGMKYEGCMRQLMLRKNGSFGDHDVYSMLKDDLQK